MQFQCGTVTLQTVTMDFSIVWYMECSRALLGFSHLSVTTKRKYPMKMAVGRYRTEIGACYRLIKEPKRLKNRKK